MKKSSKSAQYLMTLKNKHSKSSNLEFSEEMQPYLRSEQLSVQEKRLFFRIKNRLIDVKCNYKKKYKNQLECRLCGSPEESQAHLVDCIEILSDDEVKKALESHTYADIFSTNLETQVHLIKTWKQILNVRKIKMSKLNLN